MSRLKLVYHPNEILRAKNSDLQFPLSKEFANLIDQMFFAVKKFHGIGLAAPQIGKNINLAVIYIPESEIPPFAIINPTILSRSFKKTPFEEGCLSIPKKYAIVRRPEKIKVKFFNQAGQKVKIKIDGLLSKVFQHEIDHLNSKLICDKWDQKTLREEAVAKNQ